MNTPSKWDRVEYMPAARYLFMVHVRCNSCPETLHVAIEGTDDAEGTRERAATATQRARERSWSMEGEEHRCPACRVAKGTEPAIGAVGPDGDVWEWKDEGPTR